jgi:hypothetical protein
MKQRHFTMADLLLIEQPKDKTQLLEPLRKMRARLDAESREAQALALPYFHTARMLRVPANEVWA